MEIPKRIYLQTHSESDGQELDWVLDEITWCRDQINETDPEYVLVESVDNIEIDNLPVIEIDGKLIEYTGFYPIDQCIGGIQIGLLYGADVGLTFGQIISDTISEKCLCVLNIYFKGKSGVFWGLKGIYRTGCWSATVNDSPKFSVRERLI